MYHDFPPERLFLAVPKNFVGALFSASKKIWYRNIDEVSRFPVEKFLFHSLETFCRGTVLWFKKFSGFETETEYHRFPVEKNLSNSTEKLCWGAILCLQKKLWYWDRDEVSRFPVFKKNCLSVFQKIFVGEPLYVSWILCCRHVKLGFRSFCYHDLGMSQTRRNLFCGL